MTGDMVPFPPADEDLAAVSRCAECGKLSRVGQSLCDEHWGEQMLDAARARLRANALLAVDALVDITKTSTDPERVKAANSILDRAGLRHGLDVTIRPGRPAESPAELLRERLAKLQSRKEMVDAGTTAGDGGETGAVVLESGPAWPAGGDVQQPVQQPPGEAQG